MATCERRALDASENARASLHRRADRERSAAEAVLVQIEQQILRPLRVARIEHKEQNLLATLAAAARSSRRGGGSCARSQSRLERTMHLKVAKVVRAQDVRDSRRHYCFESRQKDQTLGGTRPRSRVRRSPSS